MNSIPDNSRSAYDAFPDTESVSILLVSGASRDQVVTALNINLNVHIDDGWNDNEKQTAWAVHEIPGGVLAAELTGYGDPTTSALRALSEHGKSAAVVRSNIQAHYRFGCAHNGSLVLDDDEYLYIDDPDVVPDNLRSIFDVVYVPYNVEGDLPDDTEDPFLVGLAMAERFTGLDIAPEHVTSLYESGFFAAPILVYPDW